MKPSISRLFNRIRSQKSKPDVEVLDAARKGDIEALENLIREGRDIETRTRSHRYTPLHLASLGHSLKTVSLLLDSGANLEAKSDIGATPIHFASSHGSIEILDLLICKNAQIDTRDENGQTALHRAAFLNRCDVIKKLLERGADEEATDNSGLTPRDLAKQAGHPEAASLFYRTISNNHAIKVKAMRLQRHQLARRRKASR